MNTIFLNVTKQRSGAALLIVLALVVVLTGLTVAYFSRTSIDRQLAQSSYNDTSSELLARSALDIVVNSFKQEIATAGSNPTQANIQPQRCGVPGSRATIPNLIRRSVGDDGPGGANAMPAPGVPSGAAAVTSAPANPANVRRGEITLARWNSHYLIPRANTGSAIDSTPIAEFTSPDWVLVTPQGPSQVPAPSAVVGRYAFAVYDEGGTLDMNLAGYPIYANQNFSRDALLAAREDEGNAILKVAGQPPKIQGTLNENGYVGRPFSYQINANGNPTSYNASPLPPGLSVNTTNGLISGTPTIDGTYDPVTLYATNQFGTGSKDGKITITVLPTGGPSPWPVNVARKGVATLADLRGLIAPTGDALSQSAINTLIGWRNYATTQQPSNATFQTPSFPVNAADLYAHYFLDFGINFNTVPATFTNRPFGTVSTAVQNNRTDQALISRQALLKLRRSSSPELFSQNLLQYLGTFSRERNQSAPTWPRFNVNKLPDRWCITNLDLIIPDPLGQKVHGNGRGPWRKNPIGNYFGLIWVDGVVGVPNTDPSYYGHWKYVGAPGFNNGSTQAAKHIPPFRGRPPPDFFQIINYALTRANDDWDPDVDDANDAHILRALSVGAAIINQYQSTVLLDPKSGTRTTIIEYAKADDSPTYAYGMANEDSSMRPPAAPPPPAGYVFLNRRFENVGEFGYAYDLAATTTSHTLDLHTSASTDKPLLDFFTYNPVDHTSPRSGVLNLNTQNAPVLATLFTGALLNDPGGETVPTSLLSQPNAALAANAIIGETAVRPALTRADVARLAEVAANAVSGLNASDETRETVTRILAEAGQTRTWNLMVDLITQTGRYVPGTGPADLGDPTKFTVEGEKRYWLHIALDRYDGSVLGSQLEEVVE